MFMLRSKAYSIPFSLLTTYALRAEDVERMGDIARQLQGYRGEEQAPPRSDPFSRLWARTQTVVAAAIRAKQAAALAEKKMKRASGLRLA